MSDFDPDAYLRDNAKPASVGFDPDAYLAAASGPLPPRHTAGESAARGAAQGITFGFGDEASAAASPLTDRIFASMGIGRDDSDPEAVRKQLLSIGATPEYADKAARQAAGKLARHASEEGVMGLVKGPSDVASDGDYVARRDYQRQQNEEAHKDNPKSYLGGEIGASLLLPMGAAKGATALARVANAAKVGVPLGAAAGLGHSTADLTKGDVGGALRDTAVGGAIGGLAGGLGQGAGELVGALGRAFTRKGDALKQALADKAAADAAKATASARSEAGRSAQDAYRQIENLRDLGAAGSLTPEQKALYDNLSMELAAKSAEKLPAAAAAKQAASKAFTEAMNSEAQRAGDLVAQRSSLGGVLGGVIGPRFKRYAVPAAIGYAAAPLIGQERGTGALLGLGFRPSMHAVRRMLQNPALSGPMASAFGKLLGGAEAATERAIPGASRAIEPDAASAALAPVFAALSPGQAQASELPDASALPEVVKLAEWMIRNREPGTAGLTAEQVATNIIRRNRGAK